MKNYFTLEIIALVIVGSLSCKAQSDNASSCIIFGKTGSYLDQTFTPFCRGIVADYELPGLAVGIVKNNEIVYAKGFGYLDVDSKEPVAITSLFHMASISKPFVATAIMQLVEQGKMDLDSTVTKYLPYFRLKGDQYDQITIRQMLSHVSGMPDVQDYEWDNPIYDAGALERYVHRISSEAMIAAPGEKYAYSNMAFECLGDVIAKVSGKSFAEYMKENILDPAGMKESTFLKPEYLPENWAAPHLRIVNLHPWDGYPYNRIHGPSSTLHSNVIEMCNWAIINMNMGSYNERRILDSSSYDLLWKPWYNNSNVGLSWFLGKYKYEATVGHDGGDTGFNTSLVLLPEKSIAVIVLCNLSPAPVSKIKNAALDLLSGDEPATFKKPAIIPVCNELEQNGLDAAVELWKSLVNDHPNEYNFSAQFVTGFEYAVKLDRPKEAAILTELFVNILEDEDIKRLGRQVEHFMQEIPGNTALPAALKVIEKYLR